MRHGHLKLKTLQQRAKDLGKQAIIVKEQLGQDPESGKIVNLRGRNTLYVFDNSGQLEFQHMSGFPRTTNARAEQKLGVHLQRDQTESESIENSSAENVATQ